MYFSTHNRPHDIFLKHFRSTGLISVFFLSVAHKSICKRGQCAVRAIFEWYFPDLVNIHFHNRFLRQRFQFNLEFSLRESNMFVWNCYAYIWIRLTKNDWVDRTEKHTTSILITEKQVGDLTKMSKSATWPDTFSLLIFSFALLEPLVAKAWVSGTDRHWTSYDFQASTN